MKTTTHSANNPRWWSEQHTSTWDRVRDAMHRDWEQTKADLSKKHGHDLGQTAGDTVRQATGSQPLPPANQPGGATGHDWNTAEPAVRYGYGARSHYADAKDWDDTVEGRMRTDWDELKTGSAWEDAKAHVRHGWDAAKRKL